MSNIVRETRESLGMTQMEFATELSKSLRTIAGWEAKETIDDPVIVMAMERFKETHGGKV